MKFPHIRSLGREDGWYRVGPLAQLNCCAFIDTPIAEAARKEFMALGDGGLGACDPRLSLGAVDLHDPLRRDDQESAVRRRSAGDRPGRHAASGGRKAWRSSRRRAGRCFTTYVVDDNDQVTAANLIVSTTNNNEAMNRSVTKVAVDDLTGHEITEGLLNHIEVAIRAYDPCLSCATHALGDMPLIVTLEDADGAVIATRVKQ